jgi:hypothetical protein
MLTGGLTLNPQRNANSRYVIIRRAGIPQGCRYVENATKEKSKYDRLSSSACGHIPERPLRNRVRPRIHPASETARARAVLRRARIIEKRCYSLMQATHIRQDINELTD